MAKEIENNELRLMFDVVRKYYELGMNQEQIAREEFISKSSVCRLLKKAVTNGYVQFQINYPVESVKVLETELLERFALDKLFIAPAYTPDTEMRRKDACRAAAEDLGKIVRPDDTVCVSRGSTMETLSDIFSEEEKSKRKCARIVMMNGAGSGNIREAWGGRVVEKLADAFQADGYLVPSPLFADSGEAAEILRADSHIRDVLAFAGQAQVAVFGIGAISAEAEPRADGIYTKADHARIRRNGGVGRIGALCFDKEGNRVHTEMDGRMVGLGLDAIREKRERVVVAVGEGKACAIIAALRGKLVNRLYTDEITAQAVVNHAKKEEMA